MAQQSRRARWIRAAIVAVLVALLAGRGLADRTADRLWAESLGVARTLGAVGDLRVILVAIAFSAAALWCVGNVYLFYRSIGSVHVPRRVGNIEILEAVPRRYLLTGAVVVGLLLAVAVSHDAGDWWYARSLLEQGGAVGTSDPILGRDLGYYLFVLPWHRTLHAFATTLTGIMLAVVTLLYAGVGAIRWTRRRLQVSDLARMHLAGLLTAFALALFWGYRLEPAEYVAGIHRVTVDASLLDVRIPVARLLSVLGLCTAGASLAWLWLQNVGVMGGAWMVLAVVSLAGHYALPKFSGTVRGRERLKVPELEQAVPTLERVAYGLSPHDTTVTPSGSQDPLALGAYAARLRTAPVWDPLQVTLSLNGAGKNDQYFRFFGATLGLYRNARGEAVPVYLAAREIDLGAAREEGADLSWGRVHTTPFGHATGLVAVAAGAVTEDGRPLFVPLLEPVDSATTRETDVRRLDDEVFFSPAAGDFAVVAASPGEFVGVRVGGLARRVALAWALQSPRLATSKLLSPDALLLWERQVGTRLSRYAPFARFGTPYAVFADRRLYWVATGYVSAEAFPLTRPVIWHDHAVRYLRAGFIGVVDARSGATSVYQTPEADPLSSAWARLAPEIVRPFAELAAAVVAHVRYPDELFQAQVALVRASGEGPGTAPPAAPAGGRLGPAEIAARRDGPVWWVGPWARDTSARLRILAGFGSEDSTAVTGVAQGTLVGGVPRLDVVQFSPALDLMSPAEVAQRLADVRSPSVGVLGPRRTVVLANGVLTTQSAYATGAGAPRLADVILQWGSIVARGPNLPAAIGNAVAQKAGEAVTSTDWAEARRSFERLDQARQRGDWGEFGRAYDELRRLLEGQRRAP